MNGWRWTFSNISTGAKMRSFSVFLLIFIIYVSSLVSNIRYRNYCNFYYLMQILKKKKNKVKPKNKWKPYASFK